MLAQIQERYKNIPLLVRQLLLKVVLLITVWMLLYHLILQPRQIPDRWLSTVTAEATAKLISAWFHQPTSVIEKQNGTGIFMNGKRIIFIAYTCDALELYLMYVGFLFCIPTTKKRFLLFAGVGVGVIFILNILRCFGLTWLSINKREWLDFSHHYAFTLIVYAFIFYGWFKYTKKYQQPDVAK